MLLLFVSSPQQFFIYINIKFKVKLIYRLVMLKLMVFKIHLHVYIVNVLNISISQRLLHLSKQSCGERSSEARLLSLRQVESGAKQAHLSY